MTILIESFSIRSDPKHVPEGDAVIARSFSAGVTMRHEPEGNEIVLQAFSVGRSGFDINGVATPTHEVKQKDFNRHWKQG